MKKNQYLIFTALGFDLVALVLSLSYAGAWLDKKYSWGGLGIAGGAMLALGVWFQHIFWALKKIEKIAEPDVEPCNKADNKQNKQ